MLRYFLTTKEKVKMAHNLEMSETGEVAFALRGKPAWHGLANVLFDENEHVNTSTMLDSAKLSNWDIQLEEIAIPNGYRTDKENYFVTRTNPFDNGKDVLAIVGSKYQIVQNETLFEFGDNLLDGGASWESAGSIKGGRVVFGSLVIPKEITLDPNGANDKTVSYLLVHTSHDGSVSVQASVTPVRVVCQNTLNIALKGTKQSFKLRHTQSVDGKIQIAREALGLSFAYMDLFEQEAKALFETAVTDLDFNKIITTVYPKPEKDNKKGMTRWENKIDVLNDLYFKSPTVATIKGTAWGVFNTLTEQLDYYPNIKIKDEKRAENKLASASGFDVTTNITKNNLLKAVKQLTNA
jgi:phage/plasmid-like protein (TIGR03299 family)